MKKIVGNRFDGRLSREQNSEGMFAVMIKRDDSHKQYRTGFIFHSAIILTEWALRVCQKDSDGNMKYGLIIAENLFLPCVFDKIKPYKGYILQAFIGEERYFIHGREGVYTEEFMDIRNISDH